MNSAKQIYLGDGPPFVKAQGLPTAFDWVSTPFDIGEMDSLSLTAQALAETPNGMLVVPSTTSGMGTMWVAQTAGSTTVSVTVNAPSGSTTSFSVLSSAITVSPAIGLTNAQLAMLAQQNASVWALAKPYVYGWGPVGPVGYSFQNEFLEASRNDLVTSFSQTTLFNGAATPAVSGTLTLQLSDDLINWVPQSGVSGSVTSGGNPLRLNMSGSSQTGANYAQWKWTHTPGSVGEISMRMTVKGDAR